MSVAQGLRRMGVASALGKVKIECGVCQSITPYFTPLILCRNAYSIILKSQPKQLPLSIYLPTPLRAAAPRR